MTSDEGGFCSTQDADTEGEEGRFFVWTPDEIAEILGAERSEIFCAAYDVDDVGNFEGKSILNRSVEPREVARGYGMEPEGLEDLLADCRGAASYCTVKARGSGQR